MRLTFCCSASVGMVNSAWKRSSLAIRASEPSAGHGLDSSSAFLTPFIAMRLIVAMASDESYLAEYDSYTRSSCHGPVDLISSFMICTCTGWLGAALLLDG